jgi:hypothetical protein
MHPVLDAWIHLYNVSTGYEYEQFRFLRYAGARGADFEAFTLIKAARQKAEKDKADKGDGFGAVREMPPVLRPRR